MSDFETKYPASAALILVVAKSLKDAIAALQPGESLFDKIKSFSDLPAAMIAFLPQAGSLSDEIAKFGISDDVAAVEMLVNQLGFTNDHAQAVIAAIFPVLEDIAALQPKIMTLVAAIKG